VLLGRPASQAPRTDHRQRESRGQALAWLERPRLAWLEQRAQALLVSLVRQMDRRPPEQEQREPPVRASPAWRVQQTGRPRRVQRARVRLALALPAWLEQALAVQARESPERASPGRASPVRQTDRPPRAREWPGRERQVLARLGLVQEPALESPVLQTDQPLRALPVQASQTLESRVLQSRGLPALEWLVLQESASLVPQMDQQRPARVWPE